MNAEQLLDAIGSLDEHLLADVNRVRLSPRPPIPLRRRITSIAAVFVLLFVCTLVIIHTTSAFQYKNISCDDAESSCGTVVPEEPSDGVPEEPSDGYFSNGYSDNESHDVHLTSAQHVTVTVTSYRDGHLLGFVRNETTTFAKGQTVEIAHMRTDANNYSEGIVLSVYYTDADLSAEPALIYAHSIIVIPDE